MSSTHYSSWSLACIWYVFAKWANEWISCVGCGGRRGGLWGGGVNQGHQLAACCNFSLGDVRRNRKTTESLEAMKTDIRKRKEYSTCSIISWAVFHSKNRDGGGEESSNSLQIQESIMLYQWSSSCLAVSLEVQRSSQKKEKKQKVKKQNVKI